VINLNLARLILMAGLWGNILLPPLLQAQAQPDGAGRLLDNLFVLRDSKTAESHPTIAAAANTDYIRIAPGETKILAEISRGWNYSTLLRRPFCRRPDALPQSYSSYVLGWQQRTVR